MTGRAAVAARRAGASTACCCSTSRPACRRTRRCSARSGCFDAEKAGHTGTLDPLASGLLPLCFGEATKFAQLPARRRQGVRRHGALRRDDRPRGDAEGDGRRHAAGRVRRATSARRGAAALRRRDQSRCRPCTRRSSTQGAQLLRVRARRRRRCRASRAQVDIDALDAASTGRRPTRSIDVACSKGTYVRVAGRGHRRRRSAAARTSRRCGARRAAASTSRDAVDARRARRRWRRRARARLLPVDAPAGGAAAAASSTPRRRGASSQGQHGALAGDDAPADVRASARATASPASPGVGVVRHAAGAPRAPSADGRLRTPLKSLES